MGVLGAILLSLMIWISLRFVKKYANPKEQHAPDSTVLLLKKQKSLQKAKHLQSQR